MSKLWEREEECVGGVRADVGIEGVVLQTEEVRICEGDKDRGMVRV